VLRRDKREPEVLPVKGLKASEGEKHVHLVVDQLKRGEGEKLERSTEMS